MSSSDDEDGHCNGDDDDEKKDSDRDDDDDYQCPFDDDRKHQQHFGKGHRKASKPSGKPLVDSHQSAIILQRKFRRLISKSAMIISNLSDQSSQQVIDDSMTFQLSMNVK